VPLVGWGVRGWPAASLAALGAGLFALAPSRAVLTFTDPRELLPALGGTARLVAAYGFLLALGLAFG
jgi:hypothetical protein